MSTTRRGEKIPVPIVCDDWNLANATRRIANAALDHAGSIEKAAALMGIKPTRLQRIIRDLEIEWPRLAEPVKAQRKKGK